MFYDDSNKWDDHSFDFGAAESAVYDAGCNDPEEVWDYHDKRALDDFLGEYGYQASDFMKDK